MLHLEVTLLSDARLDREGLPPQSEEALDAWRTYINALDVTQTLVLYGTRLEKEQYALHEELTVDYGDWYKRDYSTGHRVQPSDYVFPPLSPDHGVPDALTLYGAPVSNLLPRLSFLAVVTDVCDMAPENQSFTARLEGATAARISRESQQRCEAGGHAARGT